MAIYCGIDFHPRQHSISYCEVADGELHYLELHHERDDVRGFYSRFTGEVIAGLEASGYSAWFEQLLAGPGHQVWLGDAAEIRRRAKRRQKNDRRDAELILDLLLKGEFPRVVARRRRAGRCCGGSVAGISLPDIIGTSAHS